MTREQSSRNLGDWGHLLIVLVQATTAYIAGQQQKKQRQHRCKNIDREVPPRLPQETRRDDERTPEGRERLREVATPRFQLGPYVQDDDARKEPLRVETGIEGASNRHLPREIEKLWHIHLPKGVS